MRPRRLSLRVEELEHRLVPAGFHGTLPATTNATHLFSDQLPNGLSNQLVAFIASHFDGSQKMVASENARYAADNPNWVLLNYRLATTSGPAPYIHNGTWSSDWSTVNANESWFMHDPLGERFHNGTWDWDLNDITNPQFQQYMINNLLGDLQATGAQGVFADSFEAGIGPGWWSQSDPRFNGTDSANPADWPNGVDWLQILHDYAGTIENALHADPHHYFYVPNVDALVTSWANQDFSNLDGAFLEGFGTWGGTYHGSSSDWTLSMNRALALSGAGKVVIMQPTLFDTPDSTTGQRQREFLVGTYLLLKGDYTYLNMMVPNQGLGASYFPEYTLPLGAPLAGPASSVSQYLWSGVYRRDFQNGTVLVNPFSTAITVTMGANYQLATGHGGGKLSDASLDANGNYIGGTLSYQTVNSFTLQPGSAALLLKSTTSAASKTALAASPGPSQYGQSVTFTATVTPASGTGTPTGTVTFLDGTATLGTGTLNNGTATFMTSALAVGGHSVTAAYGGDGTYSGSTSAALSQTVNKGAGAVALSSSANPAQAGQSVTFTATVSAVAPAAGTPTGAVTFLSGGVALGTGTLSGGKATFTTSSLPVGTDSITASYAGDGNFTAATSAALSETVSTTKATAAAAFTASPSPSVFGQSVTFTATVTGPAGTPTGTVTFLNAGKLLGTATLVNGRATLAYATLAAGTHSLTAVYNGSASYNSSTSPALTQIVNRASTTMRLTVSPLPATAGQTVTLTAVFSAVAPGSGAPQGWITFRDGTVTIGQARLSSGVATLQTTTLAAGTHSLTAVWAGDGNYNSSTSPAVTETINPAPAAALASAFVGLSSSTAAPAATTAPSPSGTTPASGVQAGAWMPAVTTAGTHSTYAPTYTATATLANRDDLASGDALADGAGGAPGAVSDIKPV
jgi:hypothetical protein